MIEGTPGNRANIAYNQNRFATAGDPPLRLSTEKIMMDADAIAANINGICISLCFPSGAERQKSAEARE
ncbi:hypothetical protein PV02_09280 [Methanolobus chelungpuianus]|uniref:Uncharacterized protein n=2 Tax=Methanolobus chelungpuianus TaxID=502115 RepID=A0AAE3L1Z1_9EURY|nr:hypothetical protein [Methanolobus chelungpuianus]